MYSRVLFSLLFLFATGFPGGLQAQDTLEAFRSVDIGISAQKNINRNIFHRYWSPNTGLHVDMDTPFYFGKMLISGSYTHFDHAVPDFPDIEYYQMSLEWGREIPLSKRFYITGSGGILFSIFSFTNGSEEMRNRALRFGSFTPESEFGFRYGAELKYRLSRNWSVALNWKRNIVYTSTKLKLSYAGFKIVRTVQTPGWLREALR